MKDYLYSIPKLIKNVSQSLDAQSILCDKSWVLFNDAGVKQLFIFQKDGTLLIVTNGVVTESSWKYLPVNNSIIIKTGEESMMFHPAFLDDTVFALQQDGVQSCLFMIDEKNKLSFLPQTLSDLNDYFLGKQENKQVVSNSDGPSASTTKPHGLDSIKRRYDDVLEEVIKHEEERRSNGKVDDKYLTEEEEFEIRAKVASIKEKTAKEANSFLRVGFPSLLLGACVLAWGIEEEMVLLITIGGIAVFIGVVFLLISLSISPKKEALKYLNKVQLEREIDS